MDIRSDRQKGLSYKEIGKKYHLDQRTAKKYAQAESKPVYSLSGPKPSKLGPVPSADRAVVGGGSVQRAESIRKAAGAGF